MSAKLSDRQRIIDFCKEREQKYEADNKNDLCAPSDRYARPRGMREAMKFVKGLPDGLGIVEYLDLISSEKWRLGHQYYSEADQFHEVWTHFHSKLPNGCECRVCKPIDERAEWEAKQTNGGLGAGVFFALFGLGAFFLLVAAVTHN